MRCPATVLVAAFALSWATAQDEFATSGRVEPWADVVVKARVDGYVSRVFIRPGDRIDALAKLVALSAPELQAEVGRATAALAVEEDRIEILQVELEIAKKRLAIAERELKVSGEALPEAQQLLKTREEALQRAQALFEAGSLGAGDLAQARHEVAESRSSVYAAGERVKNAQDEVEIARLEVRRAELAIVRQRSRVNVARSGLELAKVRAGFAEIHNVLPDATVTDVTVAPGSMVVAGKTPLVRLMATGRVRVVSQVPAHLLPQIKAGNPVRVSDGKHPVDAQVTRTYPAADPDTGTVTVVIELDNAEGRWLPGTRVHVLFHPRK